MQPSSRLLTPLPSLNRFLLATLGVLGSSAAACHTWDHAPGYADREQMTQVILPAVSRLYSRLDACDLEAPGGRIRFTNVSSDVSNNARTKTHFDVSYLGAKAECLGPAVRLGTEAELPFACSITEGKDNGNPFRLEVAHDCTTGKLTRAAEGDPGAERTWNVETDVLQIAGLRVPAREVSLLDDQGTLVFSDAPNYNRVLFTRKGSTISPAQLLAVVAMHAFVQLKGVPVACTGRK